MYIEHPYFYEGKYYANIDGEMIEITKEVAYAMNNFYRSSKAKKVEIKNEQGKVVDKMLREVCRSRYSLRGAIFLYLNASNNEDTTKSGLKAMAKNMGILV